MSISREKYEKAKNAARDWYDMLQATKELLSNLQKDNLQLEDQIQFLQAEVQRWKSYSEQLPDEDENKTLRKTIKTLEKQIKKNEETFKKQLDDNDYKHNRHIDSLEREKMLLETKLIAMDESKKELMERYRDLKKDMVDLQERYTIFKREKI